MSCPGERGSRKNISTTIATERKVNNENCYSACVKRRKLEASSVERKPHQPLSLRQLPAHCGTPFRVQKRGVTEHLKLVHKVPTSKKEPVTLNKLLQRGQHQIVPDDLKSEKIEDRGTVSFSDEKAVAMLTVETSVDKGIEESVPVTSVVQSDRPDEEENDDQNNENSGSAERVQQNATYQRERSHSRARSHKLFRQLMS